MSIQATERYLGCKQELCYAVKDKLDSKLASLLLHRQRANPGQRGHSTGVTGDGMRN
ncbi:MAG: hypothetical protein ABSG13_19265 [Bryobacteraceae bacterium]